MAETGEVTDLKQLLDRVDRAQDRGGRVSLDAIMDAIGRRSFGPLILFAGLVTLSPVGDIPGVPTMIALFVLLIAVQLLAGHKYFCSRAGC